MPEHVKRFEPPLALFVDNEDPLSLPGDYPLCQMPEAGSWLFFETMNSMQVG